MPSDTKKESAWAPLGQPVFRALWIATVASNVGTWVHDVGAGWLMTSLAPSPLMVSLVQAAMTLPIFLFALPAGTLADLVDRRRFLIVAQLWMLAVAAGLGVLTLLGMTGPWMLLLFTFGLGVGSAFVAPAWQAVTPELVPRELLRPAVALSSLGINVSRAIGPALGGFLIAGLGVGSAFVFNALSFLGVTFVLMRWKREPTASPHKEGFLKAIRGGLRFARHARAFQRVLVRSAAFFFPASVTWALLPLLARQELGGGPTFYGVLLTAVGAGAVGGALVLPRIRRHVSSDATVAGASVGWALCAVALVAVRQPAVLVAVMALAGASWIAVLSSLNTAAQTAVPAWVRARAMAIYLMIFFGGLAGGSTLWGAVGTRFGLPAALLTASAVLVLGVALTWPVRIGRHDDLDLSPSLHWPAPYMADSLADDLEEDQGPVRVTLEYRVTADAARPPRYRVACPTSTSSGSRVRATARCSTRSQRAASPCPVTADCSPPRRPGSSFTTSARSRPHRPTLLRSRPATHNGARSRVHSTRTPRSHSR